MRRRYGVLFAVVVVVLGSRAAEPLVQYVVATDRVAELRSERDALAAAVDELEAQRAALQDPAEVELLAREELGLVRPGEIPFVVVTPAAEAATEEARTPADAAPEPSVTPATAPWWVDLGRALRRVGLCGGA